MNNPNNIWIETEEKGIVLSGKVELNDNSDAIVTFNNGEKYVATFFTYENIEWIRRKNKKTGECLNGKYFFATDLILIDKSYVLKSILNACCLYSNHAVFVVNAMAVTVDMRLVLCFIFSSTRSGHRVSAGNQVGR
jgi:hypothetical protein